jgi:Ni/Fe-hydrogenase subunit HybB-like protein
MMPKKRFPIGLTILMLITALGAALMYVRFANGLGAVTNLSDGRPWGLFKAFNTYAGIPMAAAGFTMAAVVYVFNLKQFHRLARLTVLIGLLGYIVAMLSLLVEIGLPSYFWRIFFNFHIESPLWEVIWAILIYTVILVVEFAPTIFERLHWAVPEKAFKAITIPAVITGIMISSGHQSSLGTILLNMPDALHPLWFTPFLPILFLVSVCASGPATALVAGVIVSKIFNYHLETKILSGLGKGIAVVLGIYLVLKLATLAMTGNFGLVFTAMPQNLLWWAEMLIGVIVPLIMLAMPAIRNNRNGVFTAALMVVLGTILNRMNVSMFVLSIRPGYTYFPTWMEMVISLSLVTWAFLLIWLAVRFLPVLEHHEEEPAKLKS